jgi:hypothetical protein
MYVIELTGVRGITWVLYLIAFVYQFVNSLNSVFMSNRSSANEKREQELILRGAEMASQAFRGVIKGLEDRVTELELEILINKRGWVTVELLRPKEQQRTTRKR